MSTRVALLVGGITLVFSSLAAAQSVREQAVVYGDDDRVDVYEHQDATWRARAEAHVSLFSANSLSINADNSVSYVGATLGDAMGLCEGELFADQPSAAFCSGTLIAPDLVMTAGHCMGSCALTRIVVGYYYDGPGALHPATGDDVYSCARVVTESEDPDYAVFQLDRSVQGVSIPSVQNTATPIGDGTGLVMIGSPSGIPLKIDDGGRVRDDRSGSLDHFVATTDSFGGNSGSGVYDIGTGQVVGILVSGEEDYEQNSGCTRVNYCSETTCRGENITYAYQAVQAACAQVSSPTLCGSASTCGDGYCGEDEDASSCQQDCSPVVCGDGLCGAGEYTGCPDDCVFEVPSTWECDASYYAALDGCDCECGAYDPDCESGSQTVLNCGFAGECSSEGLCIGGVGGDLCAVVGTASPAVQKRSREAMWPLGLALVGMLWWRRRRDG